MIEPGDWVKGARGHSGIVIQMKVPPRDWRYKHRLPNSGVEVLWDTGEMYWVAYRELELIETNSCKFAPLGV